MKFERIVVQRFGRLRGLDTGEAPLPGLVVVHGPNEGGKSTLFSFLASLLYGFYPASRDAHPYTPWDEGDAEGRAVVRTDAGERWEVRRRLLSTPRGRLRRDGTEEDLRNRTLPCAGHVPRAVFHQVYAITLRDLAGLSEESWGVIQDRLIRAMGAGDLVSPREVVAGLEREAGELWRPNLRGKQEIRRLRDKVGDLRERRHAAEERDRQIREMARELESLRQELAEARSEREEVRHLVESTRSLAPIREQLVRIEGLEEEAAPLEELEGLPADPEARLSELREEVAELEERLDDLAADRAGPRDRIRRYGEREERLVERRTGIEGLVKRAQALEPDRARVAALRQEIRDFQRRSEAQARELFSVPWDEVDPEAVRHVSVGEVRERIRRYEKAREERRIAEEAHRTQSYAAVSHSATSALWAGLVGLGASLVLLAAGVLGNQLLIYAAGAVAAGLGGTLLTRWWLMGHPLPGRGSEEEPYTGQIDLFDPARRREEEAREAVVETVRELPIRSGILEEPTGDLATRLERLQELLHDRADRQEVIREIEARIRAAVEELEALGRELELDLPPDPGAAAHTLDGALKEALRLRDVAAAARDELRRLDREQERVERAVERAREELARLEDRLRDLAGGDLEKGAVEARVRLEARSRARQLREDLERSHPDLREIRKRIRDAEEAEEGWTVDDDTLPRARGRIEELSRTIESLASRERGLERDLAHLQERETVDLIDGEIGTLRERIHRLEAQRDRKHLLAHLVREADRRFREEHQMDVIRRAGRHLRTITGGRYEEILLSHDDPSEAVLLRGPGYPHALPVEEPVSTGTREQLYLSLRLAVVDHLDREEDRLPLFLDETFVNWDRERRERGLELLREVSRERQVFVFTCHEELADDLAGEGARVLSLEGPASPAGDEAAPGEPVGEVRDASRETEPSP